MLTLVGDAIEHDTVVTRDTWTDIGRMLVAAMKVLTTASRARLLRHGTAGVFHIMTQGYDAFPRGDSPERQTLPSKVASTW
jgi:hypothetical protein